jgi:excisionase family DNA binding protein
MSVTAEENSLACVTTVVHLEPDFYRVEDAAAVLRLSNREIYRLIELGELETYPYKRRRLIDPASVRDLAARIRKGEFADDSVPDSAANGAAQ